MFSGPAFTAAKEARDRKLVPEEFEARFTVVETNTGAFGIGTGAFGIGFAAACNRCGALVHSTALDRHVKFHEEAS